MTRSVNSGHFQPDAGRAQGQVPPGEVCLQLDPQVSIEKAKECDEPPELGKTERKNLAFLFSDVRGFTSFSEKNEPELVIEVLNLYLDLQAKIVNAKSGDIDDYVGDQIMAHFKGRNRADTAVETAREIMTSIEKLNNERRNAGLPYFEVGMRRSRR